MTVENFDRVRQLWVEHLAMPFPEVIDKGEEYDGVDAVLVDADAAGMVSTILGGRRSLDEAQRKALRSVEGDLSRLVAAVPPPAKPYFEGLLAMVSQLLS